MHKWIVYTFFLLIGTCRVNASDPLVSSGMPEALDCFLNAFGQEQEDKHENLYIVAKNAYVTGYECGIESIGLLFDYYDSPNIPDSRKLITDLVNDFLAEINKRDKLKPCFCVWPITLNDIIMRIRIRQTQCGFVYPRLGNVAYITATDGLIYYSTLNSYSYELDTLFREPFSIPKPKAPPTTAAAVPGMPAPQNLNLPQNLLPPMQRFQVPSAPVGATPAQPIQTIQPTIPPQTVPQALPSPVQPTVQLQVQPTLPAAPATQPLPIPKTFLPPLQRFQPPPAPS